MAESTVTQRFNELTKTTGVLKESEVQEVYDQLPPVSPDAMIGKWKGGSFNTGHPTHEQLTTFKWAGKDFRSVNDVDPIMGWDEKGGRNWFSDYGHASLREVKFRGVVSTAMIYDKFPIIDSFRHVSDGVVMGAMDNKDLSDAGTYYFYLTKLE
ncbi:unnamed protein product [Clonostachys rosea]|uniref:GXWXG domain-containing protein n=1 Tax=Bionectria ochroleuca TaxID=29856 RepID=A0ABY6UR94_BIOOC|nr:unnamed protein product [Clonostachys rosea]